MKGVYPLVLALGLSLVRSDSSIAAPGVKGSAPGICPAQLHRELEAVRQQANPWRSDREVWGILVESLQGDRVLYRYHDRQYFIPASNAKILTTAAALTRLGPHYRIRTSIYGNRQRLRLVGRGDPSLTRSRLQDLAMQLRSSDIDRISTLILEDAYFGDSAIDPHWEWEDVQAYYGAPANSLILDENAIDITLHPQRLGEPLRVEWDDPDLGKGWRVVNTSVTVNPDEPEFIEVGRDLHQPVLYVHGQLIEGSPPDPTGIAVTQPADRFSEQFQEVLAEAGIAVGNVRIATTPVTATESERAAIVSPTMAELVAEVNQASNNLYAEVLLRTLGAVGLPNSSEPADERGLAVLKRTLTDLGVDPHSYIADDGSGLSRHNSVSPQALVQTLRAMVNSPHSDLFLDSLPAREIDGREVGRAKGGTLTGVSSLSGYLDHPIYGTLVFSFIVNQATQPVAVQKETLREMLRVLMRLQPCGDRASSKMMKPG